jgi:phage gpG-like protein
MANISKGGATFTWTDKKAVYKTGYENVLEVCIDLEAEAKEQLDELLYRAPRAPSWAKKKSPPFKPTGNLGRSITHRMLTSKTAKKQRGVVGTNVSYAMFIEFGRRPKNSYWTQPRPFMQNAIEKVKRRLG